METVHLKPSEITRQWYMINASGVPLGRLATLVARALMGKHKPTYSPHVDGGDFVIVINAGKVLMTGNKADDKKWFRHSGYPGGVKMTPYREILEKDPTKLIRRAVRGMLPKNRIGREMLRRMKCYADGVHPHAGQKPKLLEVR